VKKSFDREAEKNHKQTPKKSSSPLMRRPTIKNNQHEYLFKERDQIVDKSLFQLPFAHPKDMKLYYKKYGLNMRGIAPFFEASPIDPNNLDNDLAKLIN
jgi:hypothetical protein